MNLFDSIEQKALIYPEQEAIIYKKERITYHALWEKVSCLSTGLKELGVAKGDRIALLMQNCPEMIYAFYASMKLGLISVPLNVMFKKYELDHIIGDASPKVLIVQHEYMPLVEELELVKANQIKVIKIGGEGVNSDSVIEIDSLYKSENNYALTLNLEPEDEAVIGYTSGTTGAPKGAVHTHGNILAHLEGMSNALGLDHRDVFLAALPFFQLTAFLIHPGMAFYNGATLVVMEKFEASQFLQFVKNERVTFFAGVPTLYQMLYSEVKNEPNALRFVRFGICAGAPLNEKLRKAFEEELNFRIVHCYGSTETPLIAAFERPNQKPHGVSVGNVSPHVQLRLLKFDGKVAGTGEAGEIQICADNVLKYYWNKPEETKKAIQDGWFSTGDIGLFDDKGHLHIVDRAKDMIIRGGFNIYPAEIEKVLLQDPRINEAVVIGEPHHRLGEIPKAYVVPEAGAQITKEDIISLTREKLANFKVLEKVEFVSADFFPRNALGKIEKKKLRQKSS